ncbi:MULTISPECIES: depupylase/deamidase Dop [Bifidobacterium]|jgi:proteasome accessory factor A|nr:depupylase/deamidase Dop [Bifidobacterium tibiigranuli]MCI1253579.1 proteasome accessory factor PafA2 [Bifidobacterium tibiigranuli]
MSVKRVMGTETEYAVSLAHAGTYDPVRLSFAVVAAAADPRTAHIRWDYQREDPVNDARGGRLARSQARPDMLTDEPQRHITNVVAPNGGRIYVDHAHPEYSAPETTDPFAAVRYDHDGDGLMLAAARKASEQTGAAIALHRNNVDGKGASWGTHENYMMLRSVPFEQVAALMTVHFVSRQLYAGSGRVGLGERCETAGFQLSQRADYLHTAIGLQTTFDRPIVNTRDEPHAPGEYRRLHVIVGDANRMDTPQALKLGTTSMLLWMLENAQSCGMDIAGLLDATRLADPVAAVHTVSHDLGLAAELPLEGGGTITAWQLQARLLSAVYETGARMYGTDSRGEPLWPDKPTVRIMAMWRQAMADTAAVRHADDDERLGMAAEASRLEWLLKWQLLERLRRRLNCSWSDSRMAALDLRWAALDPAVSPWEKLRARTVCLDDDKQHSDGEQLSSNEQPSAAEQLQTAEIQPPNDTRAWLRAWIVKRWPDQVVAVSWSRITVRDQDSKTGLLSVDMSDPQRWTAASCADALADDDVTQNDDAAQNGTVQNGTVQNGTVQSPKDATQTAAAALKLIMNASAA